MSVPIPCRRDCLLLVAFSAVVASSIAIAFLLRFDFRVPSAWWQNISGLIVLALLIKVPLFAAVGLHRQLWPRVGLTEAIRIYAVNAGASILLLAAGHLLKMAVPGAIYPLDLLTCSVAMVFVIFGMRMRREFWRPGRRKTKKRILIYGAGAAGYSLLREIKSNDQLTYTVAGFLDDDRRKRKTVIGGAPVLGGGRGAVSIVERFKTRGRPIDEIVFAMPSATGNQLQDALANCRATGVSCKVLPGFSELLSGEALARQLREVSITDLLGRDPVEMEEEKVKANVEDRVVLVTGGAGSIGSELCRQLAMLGPRRLVILDQAESDLFRIDLELRTKAPELKVVPEIGDIRDLARVDEIIGNHGVQVVFHAAAYKHVPMMESNLVEAIQNNVLGTWNLVDSAVRHNVSGFVMISSDKAVNPTNIMGATKRVSELIVAAAGRNTTFVSVRFGNVLGSNGSVVPVFQQQIAQGGPVTVTHPEIRRFFMTIPEAVQLVLQAFTMGKGSEIFVLDMGEPTKIVDLARNLIRLAGKIPDKEIEIRITGLRPGEKLYEELISEGEDVVPTYHPKVKIFKGRKVSADRIAHWIDDVRLSLIHRSESELVTSIKELVPEWQISKRWRSETHLQAEFSDHKLPPNKALSFRA